MTNMGELLVTAGGDDIRGWRWTDLTAAATKSDGAVANVDPAFRLATGSNFESGFVPGDGTGIEVNSLAVDAASNTLFAAAGDGRAYVFDQTTQKLLGKLEGHMAFLHCVTCLPQSQRAVTGSEDGTVRFWDVRTYKETSVFPPPCHSGFEFDP